MIKIIILTLLKYPQRLEKLSLFIQELKNSRFDVEIFYGIDGNNIELCDTNEENIKIVKYNEEKYLYNRQKRLNGQPMTKGEFGCAWSHINIYKKLLKDEIYNNYLILEDDVAFNENIEKIKNIISDAPPNYDLLHLSKTEWYPFIKINKVNDNFYIPFKRFFNRTTGYMISKQGVKKLLNYTKEYISVPADDLLSSIYINTDFNLYVPENYLFFEPENTISIINNIK